MTLIKWTAFVTLIKWSQESPVLAVEQILGMLAAFPAAEEVVHLHIHPHLWSKCRFGFGRLHNGSANEDEDQNLLRLHAWSEKCCWPHLATQISSFPKSLLSLAKSGLPF